MIQAEKTKVPPSVPAAVLNASRIQIWVNFQELCFFVLKKWRQNAAKTAAGTDGGTLLPIMIVVAFFGRRYLQEIFRYSA